ncbi:MAG TPA: glycosyl transferase family 2, partial [Oribacterium sp.]|nr:glycosyl transferase family 2 [Oribacterium sp.]
MMNQKKHYKHCFSVAAYGESPYLPFLLHSLKMQTVESRVIICTSTPNRYITKL